MSAPTPLERSAPRSPSQRVAAIVLPPLVVLLLFWFGRYAARASVSPASSSTGLSAVVFEGGIPPEGGALDPAAAALIESPARVGETVAVPSLQQDGGIRPPAVELLPDGGVIVDLNLATEAELRRLPGIGPVRAKAILALRSRLGKLKGVDDLARIKGFGRARLRKLRPLTRAS